MRKLLGNKASGELVRFHEAPKGHEMRFWRELDFLLDTRSVSIWRLGSFMKSYKLPWSFVTQKFSQALRRPFKLSNAQKIISLESKLRSLIFLAKSYFREEIWHKKLKNRCFLPKMQNFKSSQNGRKMRYGDVWGCKMGLLGPKNPKITVSGRSRPFIRPDRPIYAISYLADPAG